MSVENSRITDAKKARASLAIDSGNATPEQVLAAVQGQLPALTVMMADANTGKVIKPDPSLGLVIKK